MKNFFILLRRYNFFLSFLLFLSLSLFLLFNNNRYHREVWVTNANYWTGRYFEVYSSLTDYLKLGKANQLLAEENARLRNELPESYYSVVNDSIYFQPKDSTHVAQFSYISAKVINNSTTRVNNYITINKGSLHGIAPDMAVISSNGVVGVVKDVSPHFATIMSMLNGQVKISAKIKKNEYFGLSVWNGQSPLFGSLVNIPIHAPVETGDSIITSPFSSIFPEGILVGLVDFTGKADESFKDIKVRYSTDFERLNYVYVIINQFRAERDELERRAIQ